MGAGVLELAGLEEVLHGRMAVRTLHGLHIIVDERLTLCRGAARDFHYDHFSLIAHHGSILGRCRERLGGQDGKQSHHSYPLKIARSQNFFSHADSVRVLSLEVPGHDSVGARLPSPSILQ